MTSRPLFKTKSNVVDADIGGDRALLHMTTNTYFTLNPTAAQLWIAMAEPMGIEQLVDAVTDMFDVKAERCRPEIEAILSQMIEADVIDNVPG